MIARLSLTALTFGALQVHAWGALGHATVASIAQVYLLPEALVEVNEILRKDPAPFVPKPKPTGSASASRPDIPIIIGRPPELWEVASWADDYRYTPEGKWSGQMHYVDAEDHPPLECNVEAKRDCPKGGCILTGIANYTSRVTDKDLDALQQAQALKWLTHFFGDIQQPLHNEHKAIGGNKIPVLWNGTLSNLHHIWDDEMPTGIAGNYSAENVQRWTRKIVNEIENGKYLQNVHDWVQCTDLQNAQECALAWSRDANAQVCAYVLAKDPTGIEASAEYFQGAAPIIETQIAKGGVRLAAWLNAIFAGHNGFSQVRDSGVGLEETQERFSY